MADDVEADSTDNRKAGVQHAGDEAAADAEENPVSSSNGSKPEKVESGEVVEEEEEIPKPSKLKELWAKLGLDPGTLLMMFKFVYAIQLCSVYMELTSGQGVSCSYHWSRLVPEQSS